MATFDYSSSFDIVRISVDSNGTQGNGGSGTPSISADGRYIAFGSGANNLVADNTSSISDIFVRDTVNNTTTRISVDSNGIQGNGDSDLYGPSISANGRYIAFGSFSDNLVADDTNSRRDIFVRDTVNNTTTRISVDSNGIQGNGVSFETSISSDGRYVAFTSSANNLVANDTNRADDIFVRDTVNNTTTRVSVDSNGIQGNSFSYFPSISADGRYVAFNSSASNLVADDTEPFATNRDDIFVRDTVNNTTTRVSVDSNGIEGNNGSRIPSISADGRFIAFFSFSDNLVANDTNDAGDIFVRDTVNNTTTLISVDSNGIQGNDISIDPSISADGRYIAFESRSDNLVTDDTSRTNDIFVRDTVNNTTTRVSVDSNGIEGNDFSSGPSISADGRYIAFESRSDNLVANDTNNSFDVFLVRNPLIPTDNFGTLDQSSFIS